MTRAPAPASYLPPGEAAPLPQMPLGGFASDAVRNVLASGADGPGAPRRQEPAWDGRSGRGGVLLPGDAVAGFAPMRDDALVTKPVVPGASDDAPFDGSGAGDEIEAWRIPGPDDREAARSAGIGAVASIGPWGFAGVTPGQGGSGAARFALGPQASAFASSPGVVRPGPIWIDASSQPAIQPDGDAVGDSDAAATPAPFLGAGPLGDPTLLGSETSDAAFDAPRFRSLTGRPEGYERPTGAAAVVTPGGHRPGGPVLLPGQTSPLEALSDLLGPQQRGPGARRPDGSTVLGSPGAALAAQFGIMSPSGGGGAGRIDSAVSLSHKFEAAFDAWKAALKNGGTRKALDDARDLLKHARAEKGLALQALSPEERSRVETQLARDARAAVRRKGARARQAARQAAYTAAHDAAHGGAEALRHAARLATVAADQQRRELRQWMKSEADAGRRADDAVALALTNQAKVLTPAQYQEWRSGLAFALVADAHEAIIAAHRAFSSAGLNDSGFAVTLAELATAAVGDVADGNRATSAGKSGLAAILYATARARASQVASQTLVIARAVNAAVGACSRALAVAGSGGQRRAFVAAREAIAKAARLARRAARAAAKAATAATSGSAAGAAAAAVLAADAAKLAKDAGALAVQLTQAAIDSTIKQAKTAKGKAAPPKPPTPPWPGKPPVNCEGKAPCPPNAADSGCGPQETCDECHWVQEPVSPGGGKAKLPGDVEVPPSGGAGETSAAQGDTPPLPPPPEGPEPKRPPDGGGAPQANGALAPGGPAAPPVVVGEHGPIVPEQSGIGDDALQPGSGDPQKEPAPQPSEKPTIKQRIEAQFEEFKEAMLLRASTELDGKYYKTVLKALQDEPVGNGQAIRKLIEGRLVAEDKILSDLHEIVSTEPSRFLVLHGPISIQLRYLARKAELMRNMELLQLGDAGLMFRMVEQAGARHLPSAAVDAANFVNAAHKLDAKYGTFEFTRLARETAPDVETVLTNFATQDPRAAAALKTWNDAKPHWIASITRGLTDVLIGMTGGKDVSNGDRMLILVGLIAVGFATAGVLTAVSSAALQGVVVVAGGALGNFWEQAILKQGQGLEALDAREMLRSGLFALGTAAVGKFLAPGFAGPGSHGLRNGLRDPQRTTRAAATDLASTPADSVDELVAGSRHVRESQMSAARSSAAAGATSDVLPKAPPVSPVDPLPSEPPGGGKPVTPGGSTSAATPPGGGGVDTPPSAPKPPKPPTKPSVEPGGAAAEADGAGKVGGKSSAHEGAVEGAGTASRRATPLTKSQAEAALRKRFPKADADKIRSHLDGIDDSRPIESVELKAGDRIDLWVSNDSGRPGAYGTEPGTKSGLGIPMDANTGLPLDRHLEQFILTDDIIVVRSTAADFKPGKIAGVGGKGGSTQYLLPSDFLDNARRLP
ncbi:MAG: hypothetical protein K8T90_05245 [Planctomycetes bacterium]|nr:hypothetical protein [Planctomycetota bacterium]